MATKILLPIDHTDENSWKKALPVALEQARFYGAVLEVVSVIPEIIRLPNLPENYGAGAKDHVAGVVPQDFGRAGRQGRAGSHRTGQRLSGDSQARTSGRI